jgi:hypothetical protein
MMRTTLTLEDDVAAQVESLRRNRGISLKAAINEALRRGLADIDCARKTPRQRFQTPTFDLGEALLPIDNIAEVLAIAEGDDYK